MFLYHYTNVHNIEQIVEQGMIFGSELDDPNYGYGTGPINGVLETNKPNYLPDFINRDQCIFFYPVCNYGNGQDTEIKIDSTKLDQEKLYVADLNCAQQIWEDTVHASHSGEVSNIPLLKSANDYWNSLIPLHEYLKNTQVISSPEVLYFGKIPFHQLEISTTLHPLVQKMVGCIGKTYKIKRLDVLSLQVYTNETQYLRMHVDTHRNELILSSKTGTIDENFLQFLEETILYTKKIIEKSGHRITVTYENVR